MPSILKLTLMKKPGGIVQGRITSVEIKPDQVRNAFDYAKQYKDALDRFFPFVRLDLIMDSRGGLSECACGLLDALEDLDRPVRVLIDGQCGSAATLVAFGSAVTSADITPGGHVYIHLPRLAQYKRTDGVWNVIYKLGNMSTARLFTDTYAARSGLPRKLWKQYMETGKTFTAQEAVAAGLCKRVISRWEWEKDI